MDSHSEAVWFPDCKVCHRCGRAKPVGGGELRKCGGCSVALYCSKKCQVEAWPTHKELCRSKTEEASEFGHSSMASIAKALKRWTLAHTWSLQTMVEAIAHKMGGGIDEHLKKEHVLVFVLSQGTPDLNDPSNPAKAFRLEHFSIVHKVKQDFLDENWLALESKGRNLSAAMRASLPEPERHAFAGFLPTAFHFRQTGMTSFEHYPIYRLQGDGSSPSYDHPRTEEERTLCNDVMQICSWYMNQGLALRAPGDDYNQPIPDVGSYRRAKKGWIWVRFQNWGWATFSDSDGKAAPKFTTETLRQYHGLLAHRNLDENLFDAAEC